MSGDQPYLLHEVMLDVLADHPAGLSAREFADEIARRGTFLRPSDGRPPRPNQVSARASNHRELFEVRIGRIRARRRP